ncbi:GNAT family N-acetyltransferase [Subtercola sp. RTI3]|uniref:GNAT family N-acetyltransferase n=1 Tax=Subtercola sp. RTI3 TaxID=3048639 RepID=UPI002B23764E|nr:GNAT family N-acetyltransferase [Subtercola sp. RTI3]MEA9983938.1 GNAT family N-acetyltransferase [Subtercola sp. RTI3]
MTQLFMTHPGPLDLVTPVPLSDGITLRPATKADESAIAETLAESFAEAWDIARVRAELTEATDVPVTWVAEDAQGILGVASERVMPDAYPGAGYVHYVGVLDRARGRRIGAALTARCVQGFFERGLTRTVLETDDFRAPAVVTYLRLGFVPTYRSELEQHAWSALFPTLFGTKH